MADFTKYTNYTENTSFSGVIFGGNAPVLEVELNEIQEIQNTKIRRIMQSIGDGVFITSNGSITLSGTTVTVSNCAIVSEGFLTFIDEATVTVTAENDHVYFTLQESTATSSDTLYDYGNPNGSTIDNPIADSRVGAETTRRKLVSVTLNAGDSFPSSSSDVGNIPVCVYENSDLTLYAYSDSIIGMIEEIKRTGAVTPNPVGTPTADLETIKIGSTVYKIKGGAEYVELTQAEYDALEEAGELQEDTQYYITDGEGGGTSAIDDGIISLHKTWSSNKINAILNAHVYGFNINFTTKEVTYIADAVGMTPAHMDYRNDTFDYGSWRNAFFMPRPCMLKRNGEVDFYLDPNDYEYQEDGVTPSHVNHLGNVETSSTSANAYVADDYLVYNGVLYQVTDTIAVGDTLEDGVNITEVTGAPDVEDNAMIEWGRDNRLIWYKQVNELDGTVSVYIADYQVDQNYHAWSFYDAEGVLKEHFYTPIFNGSLINTVLRSIGGVDYTKLCQAKTGAQEVTAAEKNNVSTNKNWYTEVTSDMIIICHLLTLMGKSLNTSLTYGNGRSGQASSASNMLGTGTMNNKGLFWGSNTGTYGVKVFGMENFWGNQHRRTAGLVLNNNKWYYKLTRNTNDGSIATDYNSDGTNYLTQNHTAPAANYAQEMFYTGDGAFYTKTTNATVGNTMYQDYFNVNASGARYLSRGGACLYTAANCGAFFLLVSRAFSFASWAIGASLSYK